MRHIIDLDGLEQLQGGPGQCLAVVRRDCGINGPNEQKEIGHKPPVDDHEP